jgi:hypothetical protein
MTVLECPPLEGDRIQRMHATLDEWLRSSALASLVEVFGSRIPSHLDTVALATWLLDFSEQWDFRRLQEGTLARDTGERSRWLISDASLTDVQRDTIRDTARDLGLIGAEVPSKRVYDFAWVLGGARLSNLLRPRLAAGLVTDHSVHFDAIALLTSGRPISSSERQATDTYAPEAETEFDLINRGAELAFNMPPSFKEERYDDPANHNRSWVVRHYDGTDGFPPVVSLSAPSSEPDVRRANSADTYEFFFERMPVPTRASLLLITSQIYVPYQQLEAIRTVALRHDVMLETVGFPLEWGGDLQGMNQPGNYLQEIRSTIQSANRFLQAFPTH